MALKSSTDLPKLSRVAYERIAESVPKDYFKPFVVAEKQVPWRLVGEIGRRSKPAHP